MTSAVNDQRLIKRQRMVLLALLVCLLGIFLIRVDSSIGTHPQYGGIYQTTAYDLNEAGSDQLGVFLRKHLPRRVVQSPHFPSRFKDQPRYLDLKGTQLEWSIGGTGTGWLYFWGRPDRGLGTAKWEFAPCAETDLMNVTNVPMDFYGATGHRTREVFGDRSTTNAIQVSAGQILFARRNDETNRVYVLKLKEQHENKLIVHYCVTTGK